MSSAPCGVEHGTVRPTYMATNSRLPRQRPVVRHEWIVRAASAVWPVAMWPRAVTRSAEDRGSQAPTAWASFGSLVRLGERTVVACRLSGLRLPCQCPGGNGRVFRRACQVHRAPGDALRGHHGHTPTTHTTGQKRTSSLAIEHTTTPTTPTYHAKWGAYPETGSVVGSPFQGG